MTPNVAAAQLGLVPPAAQSSPQPRQAGFIRRFFRFRSGSHRVDLESPTSSESNTSASLSPDNTISSSLSHTHRPSTLPTSQSSVSGPGRITTINPSKHSLPDDLYMLDTVKYSDLNNDWPKVLERLSGELNKTPWRGKAPWVIELLLKGESEANATPTIVITLSSSSKDTERKIVEHCSGLTWLQEFMGLHKVALHILYHKGQIRRCAAQQLKLGKMVLNQHQCEILLPKDAFMLHGGTLQIQISTESSTTICTLGGFITVGSTLYGLSVKHGIEAGIEDNGDEEDDDYDGNNHELDGQKPMKMRHNARNEITQYYQNWQGKTSSRELGLGDASPHHRSPSYGTYTTAGFSPVTLPVEVSKDRVTVNALFIPSPLSINHVTDFKHSQFDYDWALLDLSELSAEELDSILTAGTPRGKPIYGVLPNRIEAQGRVYLSVAGHPPLYGYLSSTPSSLDFGESLYDVRLITLDEPLEAGSSGAWVTLDGRLCGFIVAARKDVPWAYMVPIHPVFDQIRAIHNADVRIPSANELMKFHRNTNPTESELRHLRVDSKTDPDQMISTVITSCESATKAAKGQAANDSVPPKAICRQGQDTGRWERHRDDDVHTSEEKPWWKRWMYMRKNIALSSKSERSRLVRSMESKGSSVQPSRTRKELSHVSKLHPANQQSAKGCNKDQCTTYDEVPNGIQNAQATSARDVEHRSLNWGSDAPGQTRLESVSSLFHNSRPLKSFTAPAKLENTLCSALGTHLGPRPIPNMVSCKLVVAYNGTQIDKVQKFRYRWLTDKHSYQELTQMAGQILLNNRKLVIGKLYIESGVCRLWKHDPQEEYESRLVENESDWSSTVPLLIAGFCIQNPYAKFHLELHFNFSSISAVPQIKHKDFPQILKASIGRHKLLNFKNQPFFPRRALSEIFCRHTIMTLVNHDSDASQIVRGRNTISKKHLIDRIAARAYRLMALCVYVGIPFHKLYRMVLLEIDDISLLRRQEEFTSEEHAEMFRGLLPHQGSFFPLDFRSEKHQKDLRVVDSRAVVPIKFDESRDRLGAGQFGAVYKVTIDRDYHDFSAKKDQYFAVKRFHNRHVQYPGSLKLESHALRALSETAHPHLVCHLASWVQNEQLFMLFPHARINLHTLFRTEPTPNLAKDETLCLLRQLNGLADAVRHIHNLGPSGLGSRSPGYEQSVTRMGQLTGVHMNIKPQNILVFSEMHNAHGVWKISDFGLSSFKRASARSDEITNVCSSYLTSRRDFEPPEYVLKCNVSEKYDIWSLGCVFTEILVWALGQKPMEDFDKARMCSKDQTQEEGSMFWYRTSSANIYLNPAVDEELKSLQSFCFGRGVFEGLVRLTRKLLTIEPKHRPPAAIVCNELDVYLRQGELDLRDDEFYLHDLSAGWQLLAPPSESLSTDLSTVSTMTEATTLDGLDEESHLPAHCYRALEIDPDSASQRRKRSVWHNRSSVARTKKPSPRSTREVIASADNSADYSEEGEEEKLGTNSDVPALAPDLGVEESLKVVTSARVQSLLLGAHQVPVEYKDILPSYQLKRGWGNRTM